MRPGPGRLSARPARAVLVGLASALAGTALLVTGAMDGPERTTWDWRVRTLAGPTSATDDIVLVLVDQESLELMSSENAIDWPWPRSFYGLMLEFLSHAGAASVTIDIILEDGGRFGVSDDQELRSAAEAYGRTIYGVELLRRGAPGVAPWPAHLGKPAITVNGVDPEAAEQRRFAGASFPHPDVVPPNATVAFVNQENDEDGVFRRYRLLSYYGDQAVPSLALAPLVAAGAAPLPLRYERGDVYAGSTRVPLDREGKVLLRYTTPAVEGEATNGASPPHHEWFPAFDVVISGFNLMTGSEPTLDPAGFAGRHVMVGLSASGLLDLRPTPLDPRAPGVSVHATMLDNLLAGEFMREAPSAASIALLLLLAVAVAFAATFARASWVELVVIAGAVALVPVLGIAGYLLGYWIPIVAPLVAVVAAAAGANVANYATEGAEKRFIRGAFSQYLSPAVIAELEADPGKLALGGEKRELSMFFSDIQGFTTLSEGLAPEQLSGFLNHYLTELVTIIQDEGGTIDKFEGDAIIAFWNAPLEIERHPVHAVRAALNCQRRLAQLRPLYLRPVGSVDPQTEAPGVSCEIATRIGIHTAEVSVGNFGSRTRFDYTALGDGMNLASRLEGANKTFGTFVMVSQWTRMQVADAFPHRELGRIGVVGRAEPVTVYEPMLPEDAERRAAELATYDAGLRMWYNNRLEEARKLFLSIAERDAAARRMAAQCDLWLAGGADERASWTGVVTLSEK